MPNRRQHMQPDTFAKINDYYLNKISAGEIDFVAYRLAGGEPLLLFENYKNELIHFIERGKDKVHVEIITNLSIIPARFIETLKNYDNYIGLCVSLDSLTQSKPDARGASTSHIVINNIKQIKECVPNLNISISTVITDKAKHLAEMAKYVSDNNFNAWDLSFDNFTENNVDIEATKSNIRAFVDAVDACGYSFYKIKFDGINFTPNKGCGAGSKLVAIDTNGDIYPCQTLLSDKSEMLGSTIASECKPYKDISPQTNCLKCKIYKYCGGECKYHNDSKRKKYFCQFVKYYFEIAGEKILKGANKNA
jgi:radical SAM protein with 4Fe4S-binding SPASM domain